MGAISQISLDVLRHLQVHGLQTKSEIAKTMQQTLPVSTLSNLHHLGHIAANLDQKHVRYGITAKGLAKLRNPNGVTTRSSKRRRPEPAPAPAQVLATSTAAPRRIEHSTRRYRGGELNSSARAGSMTAYSLPSRVGRRLHWPDGRITDLDNNPME